MDMFDRDTAFKIAEDHAKSLQSSIKLNTFSLTSPDQDWLGLDCPRSELGDTMGWTISTSSGLGAKVALLLTPELKAQIRTLVEGWDTDEMADDILAKATGNLPADDEWPEGVIFDHAGNPKNAS